MSTESAADTTAVADLGYEDARDELVAIVSRIEGGNVSLEESMRLWERGEALAAHCQAKLDQAQDQLDRATAEAAPQAGAAPTAEADAEAAPEAADPTRDDA